MLPSLLAKLSNAAYILEDPSRAAYLSQLGFQEIAFLQGRDDARALLAESSQGTILAIQGTQATALEFSLILENAKILPVKGPFFGEAVAGYWDQYLALLPQLAKLPTVKGPLWLTGHSLGGSVAHLIYKMLPLAQFSGCVTFGAPKAGTKEFWDGFPGGCRRFIAEQDIAPTWPFGGMFTQPPAEVTWLLGGKTLDLTGAPAPWGDSFQDHSLTGSYIPLLEAAGL
jgi:hypothetical protein